MTKPLGKTVLSVQALLCKPHQAAGGLLGNILITPAMLKEQGTACWLRGGILLQSIMLRHPVPKLVDPRGWQANLIDERVQLLLDLLKKRSAGLLTPSLNQGSKARQTHVCEDAPQALLSSGPVEHHLRKVVLLVSSEQQLLGLVADGVPGHDPTVQDMAGAERKPSGSTVAIELCFAG